MTRAEGIQFAPFMPFLCTLLLLATGLMVLLSWTGNLSGIDQSSVAIAFAGALIGRCILAGRSGGDAQTTAAADAARTTRG